MDESSTGLILNSLMIRSKSGYRVGHYNGYEYACRSYIKELACLNKTYNKAAKIIYNSPSFWFLRLENYIESIGYKSLPCIKCNWKDVFFNICNQDYYKTVDTAEVVIHWGFNPGKNKSEVFCDIECYHWRNVADKHTISVIRMMLEPRFYNVVDPSLRGKEIFYQVCQLPYRTTESTEKTKIRLEVLNILLSNPKMDTSDPVYLELACQSGLTSLVDRMLQDKRIDPSRNNCKCFIKACKEGHLDIVKLLLSDPRVTNIYGGLSAARKEQQHIVDYLSTKVSPPWLDYCKGLYYSIVDY